MKLTRPDFRAYLTETEDTFRRYRADCPVAGWLRALGIVNPQVWSDGRVTSDDDYAVLLPEWACQFLFKWDRASLDKRTGKYKQIALEVLDDLERN